MMDVITGAYIKGEESFEFNFYTNLSCSQKLEFVNSVVDIVVDDINYNSVIRDLIFDFYIVYIFTDVDTSKLLESESFVDDVELFLEETNIVDIVKANVYSGVIEELDKAVNKSIEYRTGIHTSPLNEAAASLLNTIKMKVEEIDLGNMSDVVSKLAGMTDEFTTENIVNAYINSDFHKKNLADIEEYKRKNTEIVNMIDKEVDSKKTV